ncbi:MAG: DUF349 domain-containing protein [Gammaproteobacteria bacterium]|jgi:DNA repair protein SbcC/Rad50
MWDKLFPPKWRHRNPAIRAEAVNLLQADDPNLAQVITRDADAGIRRIAARRLEDLDLLFDVMNSDSDDSVRVAARRRIWQLLAGEAGSVSEQEAASRLNRQKDPEMAEYLVRRSPSPLVRRLALSMLDKPALLADIAMKDPDGDIRLEALNAIDRLPTLERIAREARGRDKRVARLAREMVEGLREQQERPLKQQQAVERMESYAALQQPDQTAVTHLHAEWEQLQQDAADELRTRFAAAHRTAQQAIEAARKSREELERQREVCDQAKKLLNDLESNATKPSYDIEGVGKVIGLLGNSWQLLEQELGEINAALATELEETLGLLRKRTAEIARQRKQHARQLEIIGAIEAAAKGETVASRNRLKEIEQRWHNLPGKPEADLERSFRQHLQQAQMRLEKSAERADALEAEFAQHLEQLGKALDNGKLAPANTAMGQARKCHDELQQIAPQKLKATKTTWSRLLGRLSELRDWQRFGSDRVREELIAAMHALAGEELSVTERGKRVRKLRDRWREVDRKGGAAPDAMWERFNAAAEAAYAPVVAHREAQQESQQQAAARRGEFCDSLEQEYRAIDWEQPDWPAIDARMRQLRDKWRKLGGVDKETWQILNQRFIETIEPFEERLRGVRDSEKQRRERLIKQVTRLATEPDLQTAIDETIAAQEKWKPLVTASRGVEQRLWKQFRAACDAVFERRNVHNEEVNQELGENAENKQALVDAMQALAGLPADRRQDARAERDRLVSEWNEIGQMPKSRFRQINDAWNKALKAYDASEQRAEVAQWNDHIDRIVAQAARLDALEQAMCNGEEIALEEQFDGLFRQRVTAIGKAERALCDAHEANLERRNRLMLEIEVLLGLETPEAYADERRQWQLEHLSDAMTGGLAVSPREQALAMLEKACSSGAVPGNRQQEYLARQQAIVSALKQ